MQSGASRLRCEMLFLRFYFLCSCGCRIESGRHITEAPNAGYLFAQVDAFCTNTTGSFFCTCKEGYVGNGTTGTCFGEWGDAPELPPNVTDTMETQVFVSTLLTK